jgi:UDP-glucose 4-epimerase
VDAGFNGKKIVVTGGAGFIGSHLVDGLLEQNAEVTILDDLSTGRIENIRHLIGNRHMKFVQNTITNLPLLEKLFVGVDFVFHEGAVASVPSSIRDPLKTHEINLTGTLNVLTAAKDNGVKKVVFASSSAVYGDAPPDTAVQGRKSSGNLDSSTSPKQEYMILNPQSPYAVNKLAAEYYCHVFCQTFNLSTVCLRYFNVYGPRQNPDSEYAAVIPKFVQRISAGKAPTIYGDGEQTRDFVFVRDVAMANMLAADSGVNGVFNIGTGEKISLNRLAQTILKLSNRKDLKPVYEKERPGDIKHSLADISRAKAFGYAPQYSLADGLKTLIV